MGGPPYRHQTNCSMTMMDNEDEDILKLARAFRKAKDEDVLEANNRIANNGPMLTYYAVSLPWLIRAWPALTGVHGRDGIPKITNASLLQGGTTTTAQQKLNPDCVHEMDYVLVGSNVWLLLHQKFGYDVEIPMKSQFHERSDPRWSFPTTNGQSIPFWGRFPYEKMVQADVVVSDEDTELEEVEEEQDDDDDEHDLYASNDTKHQHHRKSNNNNVVLLPAPTKPKVTRRMYGSGLGNLGNTCFMNSSLQCLAHTEPLRAYFLSGEYMKDLNRDNPLGTRGELATQFAKLLADMWVGSDQNHVVYPRDFKYTLGKHAEQFVGYDQHDSQELATYLLDALHEDCNRVTHKPYVEKPEQGKDETDQEAADKAWNLYLQRDDSQVLENFMGLVKSRLECPKCGRVSTTFDPFMYLSVPIPGSELRSLSVLYAPLDPMQHVQSYKVTVPKLGAVEDLTKAVLQARSERGDPVVKNIENVIAGELFSKKIWKWFQHSDLVDQISDSDEIIMFELEDIEKIRELSKDTTPKIDPIELPQVPKSGSIKDYTLSATMNRGTGWMSYFNKYTRNTLAFERLWSKETSLPRATIDDRARYFGYLIDFIKDCQNPEGKRPREHLEYWDQLDDDNTTPLPAIEQACSRSNHFEGVKTRRDLLILEFAARKMRQELEREMEPAEPTNVDGVLLEIRLHKSPDSPMAPPFCVRVPGSLSIYELRELIAFRLQRSLRESTSTGEPTSERIHTPNEVCKIPLRWAKRGDMYSSHHARSSSWMQLGCIPLYAENRFADPDMADEKATLDEYFDGHGMVSLEWPEKLASEIFNVEEYTKVIRPSDDSKDAEAGVRTSVTDCIDKYCLREQLEETEKWYCSQCRDHVRAWKQIDIFRSPPHLIVHLKRFQFSANSHRRQKIGGFVDFPLTGLDLKSHVIHWADGEEPIYDCYAVSNHFGGLGGGHYTAYALNDDVWCNYDDTRITTDIDCSEVVSEAAYVLYYRRRDVPVGIEFDIDLQTPDNAMPPVVIADTARSAWDDEPPSPNATMVDDDELMNDSAVVHGPLSRSTSPASVSGINGDFVSSTNSDGFPEFESNGEDGDDEMDGTLRQ